MSEKYLPNFASAEGQAIKNKMLDQANFNFDIVKKSEDLEVNITKNTNNSKIEEAAIVSFTGETIKSINVSENKSQVVNVSDLSKGAYFIRYLINGNYYSKKFVI